MYLPGNICLKTKLLSLQNIHHTFLFFDRFTHLQHQPFSYNININNNTGALVLGTCRIFMAPSFDERGTEMLLRDQRLLMIEMDKFVVACKFHNRLLTL